MLIEPGTLLTITEDVLLEKQSRDKSNNKQKERSFQTLKDKASNTRQPENDQTEKNEKSIYHFTVADLIINILQLTDIRRNSGNAAIMTSHTKTEAATNEKANSEEKERFTIIDFNLGSSFNASQKDPEEVISNILNGEERVLCESKGGSKFSYKSNEQSMERAMRKLASGENIKDEKKKSLTQAVEEAFAFVQGFYKKINENEAGEESEATKKLRIDDYQIEAVQLCKNRILERLKVFQSKFEERKSQSTKDGPSSSPSTPTARGLKSNEQTLGP